MRKWIDLVEQASVEGILYHGTSIIAAANIVKTGILRCGAFDGGNYGVSFTREKGVAQAFAYNGEEYEVFSNALVSVETTGAILVFDKQKISRSYRMMDYEWDGIDAEHEERVVCDSMSIEALVAIWADDFDCEWWINELPEAADDVRGLLKHPLRSNKPLAL
jgi:hypothetical protein